jgi:D-alanyl-D-alanine carboxypeptidase
MANQELAQYHKDLGITPERLAKNKLPQQEQALFSQLEIVDVDLEGRPFILTSRTASAWREMCEAAKGDGITINPASGFRSYLYQKKLIEKQLAAGRALEEILKATAVPGYSEHHTGRAVDLCAEKHILEERFHETKTYSWLTERAGRFGFRLSFPRDNEFGMIFEPWHWFFIE